MSNNGNGKQSTALVKPSQAFHGWLTQKSDLLAKWVRPGGSVTPETLLRFANLQFRRDEKLRNEKTWASIYLALITAAQLDLEPAGVTGEAHLVPFWDRDLGAYQVTLMPGYRGLIKMMRASGEIVRVRAHVVYENDHPRIIQLGSNPHVDHQPALGERGDPLGAYAVATFSDGSVEPEWVSWDEVMKIKNRCAGKSPAWDTWPGEMARKTAIKRLAKQMPLNELASLAIAVDNAAQAGDLQAIQEAIDVESVEDAVVVEAPPPAKGVAAVKEKVKRKRKSRAKKAEETPPVKSYEEQDAEMKAAREAEDQAASQANLPISHPDATPPQEEDLPDWME